MDALRRRGIEFSYVSGITKIISTEEFNPPHQFGPFRPFFRQKENGDRGPVVGDRVRVVRSTFRDN